jgi:hypothetical protein
MRLSDEPASLVHRRGNHFWPPNVSKLSRGGGEADGVRCSAMLDNRLRLDTTYSWRYAATPRQVSP